MPELPDVETFRRIVERSCLGREIARTVVQDAESLDGVSPAVLQRRLKGARLHAGRRHGKYLFLVLDPEASLLLHFGTNGSLRHLEKAEPDPASVRLRLDFADGGRLAYINPRRIGRVSLVPGLESFVATAGLGPDALDPAFGRADFAATLARSRQAVKTVMMDQARMAGVGNIYADEILFQAGVHPAIAAQDLGASEVGRVFDTMKRVLQTAVDRGAGAESGQMRLPAGWLLPERRPGGHCPRCGSALRVDKRGNRLGYFCPHCQPALQPA